MARCGAIVPQAHPHPQCVTSASGGNPAPSPRPRERQRRPGGARRPAMEQAGAADAGGGDPDPARDFFAPAAPGTPTGLDEIWRLFEALGEDGRALAAAKHLHALAAALARPGAAAALAARPGADARLQALQGALWAEAASLRRLEGERGAAWRVQRLLWGWGDQEAVLAAKARLQEHAAEAAALAEIAAAYAGAARGNGQELAPEARGGALSGPTGCPAAPAVATATKPGPSADAGVIDAPGGAAPAPAVMLEASVEQPCPTPQQGARLQQGGQAQQQQQQQQQPLQRAQSAGAAAGGGAMLLQHPALGVVGRAGELDAVFEGLLDAGRVLLWGGPGEGKTTLLRAAGIRLHERRAVSSALQLDLTGAAGDIRAAAAGMLVPQLKRVPVRAPRGRGGAGFLGRGWVW